LNLMLVCMIKVVSLVLDS